MLPGEDLIYLGKLRNVAEPWPAWARRVGRLPLDGQKSVVKAGYIQRSTNICPLAQPGLLHQQIRDGATSKLTGTPTQVGAQPRQGIFQTLKTETSMWGAMLLLLSAHNDARYRARG